MPDFTVINGGGEKYDRHAVAAQQYLEQLIIEILRAVPRGNDRDQRVAAYLVGIAENVAQSPSPIANIVNGALENSTRKLDLGAFCPHDDEISQVVTGALQLAAESLAQDPAAKGRRSKRASSLEEAIEAHMVNSEQRARNNGWSFLHHIMETRLGDKPTKRRFGPSKTPDIIL
jgi:hypothetical protein